MQPNTNSAYLIIRQGARWTDVFRLSPNRPLIIGRASSNEIPVPDERSSRRHAEIYFQEGWHVRDLGSRNGTFVDGVRIKAPHPLTPGSMIGVASCRLTFSHSLDEVSPSLEEEPTSPSATIGDGLPASNITHRQSKSAILDPEGYLPKAGTDHQAPTSNLPKIQTPAITLLQLAFELARENEFQEGCERALQRLLDETKCNSGGILRISQRDSADYRVVAALQRSGKAYHPPAESLVDRVNKEGNAVLARNIHNSELAGGRADSALKSAVKSAGNSVDAPSQNGVSHILNTSSAILAPIREPGGETVGFVHLYSRIEESDLLPEHLEVALAVADVLGTFFANVENREKLERKLKTTSSRLSELEKQLGESEEWVGNSGAIRRVQTQVARVAPTHATVLLRGESGVGKEVVARSIHNASQRSGGPFVALNCAALTPTLLESELFGHEKGAFTGATERKLGKFEQAHQGTLMLDELGEMSLETQAKFLRVLEGKPFERVGGSKPILVDVRVIAATNKDLEEAVSKGEFRSDLYFRLRVIELLIPPLRERREDILPIAEHFLAQFRSRSGSGPSGFSDQAKEAMLAYSWPGNIRELRNGVERAYVLCNTELAEPEDLALSNLKIPGMKLDRGSDSSPPVVAEYKERSLSEVEEEHIAATLQYTGGQKNRAAAILGIERSTLDRKLKRIRRATDEDIP